MLENGIIYKIDINSIRNKPHYPKIFRDFDDTQIIIVPLDIEALLQ